MPTVAQAMPVRRLLRRAVAAASVAVAALVLSLGCAGHATDAPEQQRSALASDPPSWMMPSSEKGGAQLWAENCMRCHNARSPSEFSGAEWGIVVQHMRLRAGLTGQEQQAILEFLRSVH